MRFFCLFFILLAFDTLNAQNKSAAAEGSLQVTVTDQQERIIASGTAALTNQNQTLKSNISSKGTVIFKSLPLGSYALQIVSNGFAPFTANLTIKEARNELIAKLKIREIKETVEVNLSSSEQRFDNAFNEVLTEEEILSLGSDPGKSLRQRYGEDILFEVDGFISGQIPSTDQIASIKIIKNSFDAEFHKIGNPIVRITTKADWGGCAGRFFSNSTITV